MHDHHYRYPHPYRYEPLGPAALLRNSAEQSHEKVKELEEAAIKARKCADQFEANALAHRNHAIICGRIADEIEAHERNQPGPATQWSDEELAEIARREPDAQPVEFNTIAVTSR